MGIIVNNNFQEQDNTKVKRKINIQMFLFISTLSSACSISHKQLEKIEVNCKIGTKCVI